jgi:hypothetical protein
VHKIAAEILAGIIPNKTERNRWRGILRYGLRRAVKLKKHLKRNKSVSPDYFFAVCAIVKNEADYFKEWLDWHISQGVEKFYIYDNESTDNTKEILEPYIESGLVEYVFWTGQKQQLPVYDDCLDKRRLEANWIAFIDLDEFIVPMKDRTITKFLERFENFAAVEINWLCFGSGGAKKREKGGVMERFTRHCASNHITNRRVKSIVNPRKIFSFIRCHDAAHRYGYAIADSRGNSIKKHFKKREPQHDVIRINHYAVKSYEEFLIKKTRGSTNTLNRLNQGYFEKFDLNDIEDARDSEQISKQLKVVF